MTSMPLYLASQSPRRAELLRQIGVPFTPIAIDVDETPHDQEAPQAYVMRLATAKAQAGQRKVAQHTPVLGADTTVVCEGAIMGKPNNCAQCVAMLLALSGRKHQVLTAVAVASAAGVQVRVSTTEVAFTVITQAQAEAYWHTAEPADKAGGYAIQGLGAVFVKGIVGSYSGVVGLPIAQTCELLNAVNVPYWQGQGVKEPI